MFNWMFFDYVGGIGMFYLCDVYFGCEEINILSEFILMDLLKWFDLIDYYCVLVMWVFNFVFGLFVDFVEDI